MISNKIVQITGCSDGQGGSTLYALDCEGKIWEQKFKVVYKKDPEIHRQSKIIDYWQELDLNTSIQESIYVREQGYSEVVGTK